ncbi:hypothetical protein [Bradyrhizobium sp. USDA 3458]|uniref:hypothetical protein n=1 Tax=Bradyrhizobium sp. USDA 3458 TaxID=2591461 RepID=UPI00132FAACC|nr:hypothetical protein [Bradyrhizobium sp. USDA 3458]
MTVAIKEDGDDGDDNQEYRHITYAVAVAEGELDLEGRDCVVDFAKIDAQG